MFQKTFGCGVLILLTATAGFAAGTLEVASRVDPSQYSATGSGPDFPSYSSPPLSPASVSADGRYAVFLSAASDLVDGQQDVNGWLYGDDVFLADLATGAVTLVSHSLASPTTTGNMSSFEAAISADGRYVVYLSAATDLAPGQKPTGFLYYAYPARDVLLYDRVTGTNTLVASSQYDQAYFWGVGISADGRYLTFASDAGDLFPGQLGGDNGNIFLYDRSAGKLSLVSHVPASPVTSPESDQGAWAPRISADGRFVVFITDAADLLPGQIQGQSVVLYDRTAGALTLIGAGDSALISADGKYVAFSRGTTLQLYARETHMTVQVSAAAEGTLPNSRDPAYAIGADGRYVAFLQGTFGSALAVYDRVSRAIATASPASPGDYAGIGSLSISGDGRYVAFASINPEWVPGQADANGTWDVFLFDRTARKTSLLSHSAAASTTTGDGVSYAPALSADGSRAVFFSWADNLLPGLADRNRSYDFFACDLKAKSTRAVTLRAPGLLPLSPEAGDSRAAALSADGRWIAFESESTQVVAGQTDNNRQSDVFLHDSLTGKTVLVSRTRASAATAATGQSAIPSISADGRWVAFFSNARNLVPGANPTGDECLFLFDATTGGVTFVARSKRSFGSEFAYQDPPARLSPDGRWLVFLSSAPDVVPGQQETVDDGLNVFLWDRTTGATTLVSHAAAGPTLTGNGESGSPALSADGRWVAFRSDASNLVAGQTGLNGNVFLWDRTTGAVTLVSHSPGVPGDGAGAGRALALSADGRFLAFDSSAANLDPSAFPHDVTSVYEYDRAQGTYSWVGGYYSLFQQQLAISADGGTVAFLSDQALTPGSDFHFQIFLYDRPTRSLSLVTRDRNPVSPGSREADFEDPVLSSDGRYLAFASDAPYLVPGQITPFGHDQEDIFLYDRTADTMTLVSRWQGSEVTTAGSSKIPLISADGRRVAFTSQRDLVAGDYNRRSDAYLFRLDGGSTGGGGGPVTIPPCLLFDTRRPADGPALRSNMARIVKATGVCGVPATAKRVTAKITAFQETGKGNVRLYPGDLSQPSSGILRFSSGQTVNATFDLPVAPNAGTLTLLPFVAGRGTAGVSVEIDGYTP
ncbi:MAG TPA: hypothetical protein VFR03_10540 [Thermoanaerobaculia bacterium]|nr:hypothetical protein [Thermoanaerobaculia bacterium]